MTLKVNFYLILIWCGELIITKSEMQIVKNRVLLLKAEKSEQEPDKYEVMLSNHGFDVKYLKTLQFTFKQLDLLGEKLSSPQLYDGLIFTTPRSVKAVKNAYNGSLSMDWHGKANYVVGETTHELILNTLDLNCAGRESGNGKNLAEVIIADKSRIGKPLLFPCGNLTTETLIERLRLEEVMVDALTVYDTGANPHLDEEFSELTSNFSQIPEYFVYFSPSGVASTLECLHKLKDMDVKFVAIGPTTEDALKRKNIPVHAVCVKPTPRDLLDSLKG